ncbi:MAG TPA: HEAT repeat domain-containing protein [Verrucomicrobiae bacterium]|nr:HEAT repeat domain-containing protein [Verrucomicrobiae bacterium]
MKSPISTKRAAIGAVIGLGILGLVASAWINRGPFYEGKSATYWTGQLARDRSKALRALRELGPAAVPALVSAVNRTDSWWNQMGHRLRPKLPKFAARHLPNPIETGVIRDGAVEVLYELGTNAAPAVPALIRINLDANLASFSYTSMAHATLLKIGEAGVPQLIAVLNSRNPRERAKAAAYLGVLGPKAGEAAPALGKALNDPNSAVRKEAVTALWQIGPPARAALPQLKAALRLDDDYFRLQVVHALWDVGLEAQLTVPILIGVLENTNNPNRAKAAMILAEMGPAACAAAPALTNVLREEFSYTRVKAEEALRRMDSPTGTQASTRR